MKWIDILTSSLNNLLRRKLRSALTMLGVVIGTAAIIVTISLGYGAEETQMSALESATNLRLITVYPYMGYSMDESSGGRRVSKINDSVIRQLRAIDGVDAVTPIANIWGMNFIIKTGKLETYTMLTAVIPEDFAKIQKLKSGTYFTGRTDRMEFIMSEIPMMEFRDPKRSNNEYVDYWSYLDQGKELPLPDVNWLKANYTMTTLWEDYNDMQDDQPKTYTQDYKAQMRGIIAADLYDWTFANGVVVNIDWYKRVYRENRKLFKEIGMPDMSEYDQVYVLAKSVDDVEGLVKELNEFGVQSYSPMSSVAMLKEQIRTMQTFMGFIGAISMLVAALSIANTMMMSIYERTREIGVMKVLGCKLGNIRAMFLCEAAYIGIFGGLLGVLCSYGLSYALNNVDWLQQLVGSIMSSTQYFSADGGNTSVIPAQLSMGTWLFVVLISIASGISPAQRAMRLSSLAAIRSAD